YESIKPKLENDGDLQIKFEDDSGNSFIFIDSYGRSSKLGVGFQNSYLVQNQNLDLKWSLLRNCSRIFIGKSSVNKVPESPSEQLESDGSNLENIIKKI